MFASGTVDVDVEHLDVSGDGVARTEAGFVIVPFTLPGERVRIRLPGPSVRQRDRDPRALLVQILRASPHRVTPGCPHFGPDAEPGVGPCGGCSWQHIAYDEQLRLKTAAVDRIVGATVQRAPAARPTIPTVPRDNPWGYRHKVHFVFGTAPGAGRRARVGELVMGHYARGSRRVIPVRECPVHDERGNTLAFMLADYYAGAQVAAADDVNRHGTLRGLAVRVGRSRSEIGATLVVTDDRDKRLRTVTRKALEDKGAPTSFHVNVHPRDDGFIFGRDTRRISGPERIREDVAGTAFLVSPTAFFQTNVEAAEVLVRLVLEAVTAPSTVLDLYAGAGLFALPLARAGHRVTAVEGNAQAVSDGEAAMRLNRIAPDRCRFIARPVEAALPSLRRADVVVLDPPRDGCAREVIEEVFGRLAPRRAIYVSCNPEALGRDLAEIAAHGYSIRSMQPVDMFPHTAHIETVVVLDSRAGQHQRQ